MHIAKIIFTFRVAILSSDKFARPRSNTSSVCSSIARSSKQPIIAYGKLRGTCRQQFLAGNLSSQKVHHDTENPTNCSSVSDERSIFLKSIMSQNYTSYDFFFRFLKDRMRQFHALVFIGSFHRVCTVWIHSNHSSALPWYICADNQMRDPAIRLIRHIWGLEWDIHECRRFDTNIRIIGAVSYFVRKFVLHGLRNKQIQADV